MKDTFWLLALGVAIAVYLASRPQATPYSVYPEFAYTAQTSMAASPGQKALAAVVPISQGASVQQAEQMAILAQCLGNPKCSILLSDKQLGL